MARRILSADSVLNPVPQASLSDSVRTESRNSALVEINRRWDAAPQTSGLLDWEDQSALMREIQFVNRAQAVLDEAAVKIAPSVLRIVLTVKENIAQPAAQREFLAEHLDLDFRRISELCIAADAYGLIDPHLRASGLAEIEEYGWSKALKLAHVPLLQDRREIWEQACAGGRSASYRAVLDSIRRFRDRKQIGGGVKPSHLETHLQTARERFSSFAASAQHLVSREDYQEALSELSQVQKELNSLKLSLREHMELAQWEELAAAT